MTEELYKKYRPKNLSDVFGQSAVTKAISKKLKHEKLPHSILLTGPSGTGKTTIARILKSKLKCADSDYREINGANFRGVDDMRSMLSTADRASLNRGGSRIYVLDECHQLTNDAQNVLLKALEDTPKHVYFILCTTHEQKLIPTVRNRCTTYTLASLPDESLSELITSVLAMEKTKLDPEVIDLVVEYAQGSARKALVILDQVYLMDSPKKQIATLQKMDPNKQAKDLCQLFFKSSKPNWKDIAALCQQIEASGIGVEDVRWAILGYAKAMLYRVPQCQSKACAIIMTFENNFYDSKWAGFAAAAYQLFSGK